MARDSEGQNSVNGNGGTNAVRDRAGPDPFLVVCRCFRAITAVAGALCIAANVISAVRSFQNGSDIFDQIFDGIFRCYAVAIAVLVVVAETEWEFVMKFWKVLDYWSCRGVLQIFVAVMTKAYPENSGKKVLILLQNIASYMLLACGVIYLISGFLCVGLIKRSHQKKKASRVSRDQAVKDLQELEQRREELQTLLLEDGVGAGAA